MLKYLIFRHKKVLCLNVFSWGLLLKNGEKNTEISKGVSYLAIIYQVYRNDSNWPGYTVLKYGDLFLRNFFILQSFQIGAVR